MGIEMRHAQLEMRAIVRGESVKHIKYIMCSYSYYNTLTLITVGEVVFFFKYVDCVICHL